VILAAWLVLLAAPAAADLSYVGEGFVALVASNGEPVRLEGGLVPVAVSLRGAPPGAFEAAERAFAGWQAALAERGVELRFLLRATTQEGQLSHRDGVNFVFWGECRDVARTRTYAEPGQPALVRGFDIVLNRARPWGLSADGRVGYDAQSVLAHEVGHVLGLADVCHPDPQAAAPDHPHRALTMYGWGRCGETFKRTLKEGDLRGVEFVYGRRPLVPSAALSAPGAPSRALLDSAPERP
jgi:hypothetical protein